MKNLENYGVLEMNAKEIKEIDGGFWQFVVGAIVGGILYDGVKAASIWVLENQPDGYVNSHQM
ncbi:MAG: class IIb bacteriocin, lactobin A/cerein 7B family [Lutibacter sp.]|nr:class IIb bacteriocin, lactobin A/cerein 7B family [Lutibacter sp.]MDT8418667.1 class IIb bacteriocin, lactobin A/cerein 7B family [Lutibacter sp.]